MYGKAFDLRRRAFRMAPWLFPDPRLPEVLRAHRQTDFDENRETAPPPDEAIGLHAIWALEYYAPSHVEGLIEGLTKLGWNKPDLFAPGGNVADWARRFRDTERGGAWLELGFIERPGNKRFLGNTRNAPIPSSFDHAFGSITSLTSSITCVMIAFITKPGVSTSLEQALRKDRSTACRRTGTAYSILSPRSLKRDDIAAIRRSLRTEAANWFKQNLPGLFSYGHIGDELPTCELLTLKTGSPFAPREDDAPKPDPYLDLLGVARNVYAWESQDLPGLYWSWPTGNDELNKFHAIITARAMTLSKPSLYGDNETSENSFPHLVDDRVHHMLQAWGLLALLSGYQTRLNRMRDSNILGSRKKRSSKRSLSLLASLASSTRDIVPIAAELSDAPENADWIKQAEDFEPLNKRLYGDGGLASVVAKRIRDKARLIRTTEQAVRELVSQNSAILSAYENVRIQAHIRWVTIFTFLVAVAAVLFAAENSKIIRELWFSLLS